MEHNAATCKQTPFQDTAMELSDHTVMSLCLSKPWWEQRLCFIFTLLLILLPKQLLGLLFANKDIPKAYWIYSNLWLKGYQISQNSTWKSIAYLNALVLRRAKRMHGFDIIWNCYWISGRAERCEMTFHKRTTEHKNCEWGGVYRDQLHIQGPAQSLQQGNTRKFYLGWDSEREF